MASSISTILCNILLLNGFLSIDDYKVKILISSEKHCGCSMPQSIKSAVKV